MNTFLAPGWDERLDRLRLGIQPVDALADLPGPLDAPAGIAVHLETVPRPHPVPQPSADPHRPTDGAGLPLLRRSPTGRFAVLVGSRRTDAPARLDVRIVDGARRYVPRRLSVPVPDVAAILAADEGGPFPDRACRPALFPGATYGVSTGATAVRGRVLWSSDGAPAQWARVEARLSGTQAVSWRAHADQRGEFLLLVGTLRLQQAMARTGTLDLDVTVRARPRPASSAPVDSPTGSRADPLWHLPVERVGTLTPGDPVTAGTAVPPGYTATLTRAVRCRRGHVVRPDPFVLP
ncbi:hypothetical protein SAMN05660464_0921 [Geodermatophilus dictyosporus]|uniref:Uncharacterized protein n=1 Tax=Geodermatophilus dictyosporus TaxID=1523247 RepID=A0A1I5JPD6_9ACTN|nr:hypothetical protein [Geodermatophilus dictyosporus]SFO74615.1 hypothetical protein SAMN05660464_0921 [Geodermatophilus dictyosporus]